jgi:hypothetical protein
MVHRAVVKLDVSKTSLTSQKLLAIAAAYPDLEELNVDECSLNGQVFFKEEDVTCNFPNHKKLRIIGADPSLAYVKRFTLQSLLQTEEFPVLAKSASAAGAPQEEFPPLSK